MPITDRNVSRNTEKVYFIDIFHLVSEISTACQRSCGKVMFLNLFVHVVCVEGACVPGGVCMVGVCAAAGGGAYIVEGHV